MRQRVRGTVFRSFKFYFNERQNKNSNITIEFWHLRLYKIFNTRILWNYYVLLYLIYNINFSGEKT